MRGIRSGFAVLLLSATAALSRGQETPRLTPAEARRIIADGNVAWGKARVALDQAAFQKMLAPDFYVQLPDQKMTRQQFLDRISSNPPGARLTRFDASVLTVSPSPTSDGWVALIQEKLEYERADGKGKAYALWITRDGWKKVGDQWVVTFSEALGNEFWRDGATPPFKDW